MDVVITAQHIRMAALKPVNEANMNSVLIALDRYGRDFGMDRPHRVVQFLAQLMHESGDFRYDREVWGPTKAQARYETRTDLGNTAAIDGDGKKYMGRTGIELTGRANYQAFHDWCEEHDLNPPDFVADPDLLNADPWEGLVTLWYWDTRDLNRYADRGDIETITKKINGGMNGFADRVLHFARLALVVLGFGPDDVKQFQAARGLIVDGDVGPRTRAALHADLLALSGATAAQGFMSAPVVADKPVVPVAVDVRVKQKFGLVGKIVSVVSASGLSIASFAGFDWKALIVIFSFPVVLLLLWVLLRHWIISAIKDVRTAVEG